MKKLPLRTGLLIKVGNFLLVVNLDAKSSLPTWIANPYIWLDFEKFKAEGAIAVIDQKVRTEGGESRPETLEDRAKRFSRLQDAVKEKNDFLKSGQHFSEADREVESIISMLKDGKEKIEQINSLLKSQQKKGKVPIVSSDIIIIGCFSSGVEDLTK